MKNRNQYKIWKYRDGGGNNDYKIFMSWLEEGNILNTISCVELFITTMKMKNNFCNGRQNEMQKTDMEEGIIPIKSLRARWGRKTFQTQYTIWNCPWLQWKWKIISAMDTNMQCKKARMDEGIIPIKPLPARWRRETFQTQHPMWNFSWLL